MDSPHVREGGLGSGISTRTRGKSPSHAFRDSLRNLNHILSDFFQLLEKEKALEESFLKWKGPTPQFY